MRCPKHTEVGEFYDVCPICSDEVDFWPIADYDSPVLRQAIKQLPKSNRPQQMYPVPVVKYNHFTKP